MKTHASVVTRTLILLSMLLCFTAMANANAPKFTLKVFVKDFRGEGVSGVRIVLAHTKKDFVREMTTNKDGFAPFDDLIRGKYDLIAEKEGFGRFISRNLEIDSSTTAFNISLKPQQPNFAFTDISVSEILNITQDVLKQGNYSIVTRYEGVLKTDWKTEPYTVVWLIFTYEGGYRRKMYTAYVRPDGSFPDRILFNLDPIAQDKRPKAILPSDIDITQQSEPFYKTAYDEYLALLKRINELILQKGGKPA